MKDWQRLGLNAQDTILNNWVIQGTAPVESLYNLLHEHLISQSYLQGDETPIQVLREPGKKATSKSYMWVARSVKNSDEPIVFYAYSDSRSGKFAQKLYTNFTGTLQCDGYAGYNLLGPQVVHVGCWSHVRRKFYDAAQVNRKTVMSVPLKLLDEMFALERQWQNFSPRARRCRWAKLNKLVKRFWHWIDTATTLPKARLGKAIQYARNQRDALNRILNAGAIDWSNNAAGRDMKNIVIGRKNWLFSTSPTKGARANAIWMTLIESAKACGLDPQKYLQTLLTELPQLPVFAKKGVLEAYLPWNQKQIVQQSKLTA